MKPSKIISLFTLTIFLYLEIAFPLPCRAGMLEDWSGAPLPLSEEDRATLGVIGLAQTHFSPKARFETYAVGKASGIGRGFLEGFSITLSEMGRHGTSCQGTGCGAVLIIFLAAGLIGGTIGAISGAFSAISPAEAARIEESARGTLEEFRVQELLRDTFVQTVREKTRKNVVILDDWGPREPGEKVDYLSVQGEGIQTVLEIAAQEIGFKTPPRESQDFKTQDPSLNLFLKTRIRLVRVADGKTLYAPRFELVKGPRKRAEWEAENSKAFFEELEALSGLLAGKVTDDLFLTLVLP